MPPNKSLSSYISIGGFIFSWYAFLSRIPTENRYLLLSPNRDDTLRDGCNNWSDWVPDDIQQYFPLGSVKDFDQVARLLPDVERVLPRRPGTYVLAVTADTWQVWSMAQLWRSPTPLVCSQKEWASSVLRRW